MDVKCIDGLDGRENRTASIRTVLALTGMLLLQVAPPAGQHAVDSNGGPQSGGPAVAARPEDVFDADDAHLYPQPTSSLPVTVGNAWVFAGPAPMLHGGVTNLQPPSANNPVCGAIHAILPHPTDPDIAWIGSTNGGVWKTTNKTAANAAVDWLPLTDSLPSLSISSLDLDPTDASNQTVLAGIGRYCNFGLAGGPLNGVLRSTDGGSTWAQLGTTDLAGTNVAGVAGRGNVILVGTNNNVGNATPGVYRSTDGGASFDLVSGTNGLATGVVFDIAGDPLNSMRFYAGVGGNSGGVFRSDDGGASWTDMSDAAIAALVSSSTANIEVSVGASAGNPVYVGIINPLVPQGNALAGLFRSANQGATWTAMDLPNSFNDPVPITNATNASPIVITTMSEHGAKTGHTVRIQGVTGNTAANGDWKVTVIDTKNFSLDGSAGNGGYAGGGTSSLLLINNHGGQGTTNFSIKADPTSDVLVYVGGDRPTIIFRGDASVAPVGPGAILSPQWTQTVKAETASNSGPHADSRDIEFDANGDLLEGDDGGIYRRTDPQSSSGDWFTIVGNLGVAELHDVAWDNNSAIAIGGAQDNGTPYQRSTGSEVWETLWGADGGDVAVDVLTLDAANRSIRYFSQQNLGRFKRRVFDAANTPLASNVDLLPAGGLAGFVPQFVTPIAVGAIAPPPGQSARLVIGGKSDPTANPAINVGAVYEATNAGLAATAATIDWTQVPTGPGFGSVNRNAMALGGRKGGVAAPAVLYVGSGSAVFLRTTAGGMLNPTSAIPGGPGTIVDVAMDPDDWTTACAVDSDQVFRTVDAGATWTEITGNLVVGGAGIRAIEVIPGLEADKLVVATNAGVACSVGPNFDCWFTLGTDLPNAAIWDLDYNVPDDLLVAGTLGRGAWILSDLADLAVPTLTVPGRVDFPDTCVGDTSTETLNVCNTGKTDLLVNGITSDDPQFTVVEPSSGYPLAISPDFCFPFQVKFTPTTAGDRSAVLTIDSTDPCLSTFGVDATGTGVVGNISITGSAAFGDVCADETAEKAVSICNTGFCDLSVTSVSVDCPEFTLVNNPFPATVSHDFCLDLVIRFTPTSCGPKTCHLTIHSDDPDTPVIVLTLTANTPCPAIDVPPDLPFPPTVIQSVGPCGTDLPFPISNTDDSCPLTITDISISVNPAEFSIVGLPSFPIVLEPGHIVGEGDLRLRFTPLTVDRDLEGELSVTWVTDPVTGDTATVKRKLCGEGVRTGARVLVKNIGVPVGLVKSIKLHRMGGNDNQQIVDTVDTALNLPLVAVTPSLPCLPFQYHREYGTVSNPIMLAPGTYQVAVQVKVGNKMFHKEVAFSVTTCEFNPSIVVNLP